MKQRDATEAEVINEFQKEITDAWKDINQECHHPTIVPMHAPCASNSQLCTCD